MQALKQFVSLSIIKMDIPEFLIVVFLIFLLTVQSVEAKKNFKDDLDSAIKIEKTNNQKKPFTEIVWLQPSMPRHFNPAISSQVSIAIIGAQIFASPLRYNDDWTPLPYLAKNWNISKDGLSLTLNLVKGATFHDGKPITSEDVAFSIMVNKKYHQHKTKFSPVQNVDTPDAHTVIIRLKHPHPAILLAMSPAMLPIIPKHVYGNSEDLKTHSANLKPIGSGPFKLKEFIPDEYVLLERNEHFFIPHRPRIDRIMIRLGVDPLSQMVEMKLQEAHLMTEFGNYTGLGKLEKIKHLIVTQAGNKFSGGINWLAFNLLRKPLNDIRVRQAIAYAIDFEFIIKHMYKGTAERAYGPIVTSSPFYEDDIRKYHYDKDRSNQILDKAGYKLGPDKNRFSLTIDHMPAIPNQQYDIALYLKHQLSKIGIDIKVRSFENFSEWLDKIGNWDFDMTLDYVFNWGDPVIGVHRTYICDNIRKGVPWSNTQNYCNPHLDKILNQALTELDTSKRKALYSDFQKIITQDLPIVFINLGLNNTVYHTGLGNPPINLWGAYSPLDEIYWKKPPDKKYVPVPGIKKNMHPLKKIVLQTLILIQQVGLYQAREILQEPDRGFMDLKGSGRHVIGLTKDGFIFLDNSNQARPGLDISGIIDMKGVSLLSLFIRAADGKFKGLIRSKGVWPHPVTHKTGTMSAWCGKLTQDSIICALEWEEEGNIR
ncbi:peptide ABC transporter substrate-binding protein [Candidatus Magnetomorum sp. HK-1]|nr:peptide ABC transporter substrate-binding protein [Candidatus Magnetomorum sp. HK-1]